MMKFYSIAEGTLVYEAEADDPGCAINTETISSSSRLSREKNHTQSILLGMQALFLMVQSFIGHK